MLESDARNWQDNRMEKVFRSHLQQIGEGSVSWVMKHCLVAPKSLHSRLSLQRHREHLHSHRPAWYYPNTSKQKTEKKRCGNWDTETPSLGCQGFEKIYNLWRERGERVLQFTKQLLIYIQHLIILSSLYFLKLIYLESSHWHLFLAKHRKKINKDRPPVPHTLSVFSWLCSPVYKGFSFILTLG